VFVFFASLSPAHSQLTMWSPMQFSLFDDWLPKHTPGATRPKLDTVISGLRARGITSFAIVGYCYGARSTFDYAQAQLEGLKAIAVAHPTFLQVPEDLQKLLEVGKVPLLINSCEFDPRYPIESQKIGDELLGDGKYTPGYKRTYWPGCTHGFAVSFGVLVYEECIYKAAA